MDWEKLIPGHPGTGGRLGTKKDVQDILAFLQEASTEVKKAAQEGKCWDTVEKEMKLPKHAHWPNYETAMPFVLSAIPVCGAAAPESSFLPLPMT